MRKLIVIAICFVLLLSACSFLNEAEKEVDLDDGVTPVYNGMGDLREETESKETLPQFLNDHHDNMKVLYSAVPDHQELLEQIPCYCGCGESVGHGHSYHCFVHENHENGSIIWDDHATRCQVCLDIAAESIVEYNEGKSIEEVRQLIEEKYEDQGYPEPTKTPKVRS